MEDARPDETSSSRPACICFHTPVRGIEPLGVVRHTAATLTVADVEGLIDALPISRTRQ